MVRCLKDSLLMDAMAIFCKRNLVIITLIIILTFLLSTVGALNYKAAWESQGAVGGREGNQDSTGEINIMSLPSPFSIFYPGMFRRLTANINAEKRLNIQKNFKGASLFEVKSIYFNFCGLILIAASLSSLLTGSREFWRLDLLKFKSHIMGPKWTFFSTLFNKIVLISLIFFSPVIISAELVAILFKINLFNIYLVYFLLLIFLTVTFFTICGAIIGSRFNLIESIFANFLVFLVFVFLIPLTISGVMEIHAGGLDIHDSQVASESGEKIKEKAETYHLISSFFPTSFYLTTVNEFSGCGYNGFDGFYRYSEEQKRKLSGSYPDEKYNTGKGKRYFKENNAFFSPGSGLPHYFLLSITITFLWIFILLVLAYKTYKNRFEPAKSLKTKITFPEEQHSLFILCKNVSLKNRIFQFYREKGLAICIPAINPAHFDLDLKPEVLLKYLSRLNEVEEKKVMEYLFLLRYNPHRTRDSKNDIILKVYTAVKTAGTEKTIVLNDFLEGRSREFETDVLKLLSHRVAAGRYIVYLSCEMYETHRSFRSNINIKNFLLLPFNTQNPDITLR